MKTSFNGHQPLQFVQTFDLLLAQGCFGSRTRYLTSTKVDSKGKVQVRRVGVVSSLTKVFLSIGSSISLRLYLLFPLFSIILILFLSSFLSKILRGHIVPHFRRYHLPPLSSLVYFIIPRGHIVPHFLRSLLISSHLFSRTFINLKPLPGPYS